MAKPNKDSQKHITVEDLLQLKRSERPDEAFWGQFDWELQQRMMQTLVKKNPLHLQVWSALSGRLTQSIGVACTAIFLAVMVVRPALVGTSSSSNSRSVAQTEDAPTQAASVAVEVLMSDLGGSSIESAHDYSIEGISAEVESPDSSFTRDFAMVGFVLGLDADYSSDAASSRVPFGSIGVATTLVY